jgi:cysteine desulfurase/selenocysteine lyase
VPISGKSIKSQFPIFNNRPELIYLDNAATSQKPQPVIRAITHFYENDNSNVHRGLYELSNNATKSFEVVRTKVSDFIGATDPRSIVFTKGATESINIVAQGFLMKNLKKGDNVVVSAMEHHANLIPWQQVCKRTGAILSVIPIDAKGELEMEKFDSLLSHSTKLVAVTQISNVLGAINPIGEIIEIAHKKNIPVLVDAAQSVGHTPLNVKNLDVDFLVFSAHKMFGPMGTGVLYSREKHARQIDPLNFGGGIIRNVEFAQTEFLSYPTNLEAGTSNVPAVIGLGAAIDFISQWNLDEVASYTHDLAVVFKEKLRSIGKIQIMGDPTHYGSIVSFNVDKIHAHDVAGFLANENIAVRAGHHCAQPLHDSMGISSSVRVSFSIYNNLEDVDKIIGALIELKKFWS